jgi:RNA polymerase sigma-70 factor (ECF subfamily)
MVTAALGRPGVPASSLHAAAVPSKQVIVAGAEPQDVLSLAKAGDQAAFASLVRRHQNMVFSVALHMLRSRAAAEDLAQEVFLELYRSLSKLESDSHLVFWLRRVTSHRCIDEIRRRHHHTEFPTDTLPEEGQAPEPREIFVADRLQSLVAALPEPARIVVVLRYQEEMDLAEIATTLNMPLNTVKSHLRRSISALRAQITGKER